MIGYRQVWRVIFELLVVSFMMNYWSSWIQWSTWIFWPFSPAGGGSYITRLFVMKLQLHHGSDLTLWSCDPQVVGIIESRARGLDLLTHNYYELLYAFHITRHNYRKGWAQRLSSQCQTGLTGLLALKLKPEPLMWVHLSVSQRGQSCLSLGCVSAGRFELDSVCRNRWTATSLRSTVCASSGPNTPGSSNRCPGAQYVHTHTVTFTPSNTAVCVHLTVFLLQYERPGASPKRNSDGEFPAEPGEVPSCEWAWESGADPESRVLGAWNPWKSLSFDESFKIWKVLDFCMKS